MATQPIETMTALKCQSCNAPLTVSPDDVVIVCGYCGFTSTVEGEKVEKARAELEKALTFKAEGKKDDAARCAVKSYQMLFFPP